MAQNRLYLVNRKTNNAFYLARHVYEAGWHSSGLYANFEKELMDFLNAEFNGGPTLDYLELMDEPLPDGVNVK